MEILKETNENIFENILKVMVKEINILRKN